MQVTTNWHSHLTFEEGNPERWAALRKFLVNSNLTDNCHVWDEDLGNRICIRLDWRGETLGIAEYTESDIRSIAFTEIERDLVVINQRPRGNERKLIQRIYDEFKSTNKWPNSRELSVRTKDLGNYYKIVKQANRDYLRGGEEHDVKATSRLSIRGVSICEGSDDDLNLFIQVLKVFLDTYNSSPQVPKVRMLDLCESGPFTREQIDRISLLLREEGRFYNHSSTNKDGESTFTVSPGILEFEGVDTIQDILKVMTFYGWEDEHEERTLQSVENMFGEKMADRDSELQYDFDLFISYSSVDKSEALVIKEKAEALGLKCFRDKDGIKKGKYWDPEIRQALINSREIVVLATPNSKDSKWIYAEAGAAWVLGKDLTPIILRCDYSQLHHLLQQREGVEYHEIDKFLEELAESKNET